MINFINNNNLDPYKRLRNEYAKAFSSGELSVEAINIASYDRFKEEVNSRYVNLKFIDDKEFIFFSNYRSPKSHEFKMHDQISATFYWSSTNVQIRMKAIIRKTPKLFNKKYFELRESKKNALAISSMQSQKIDSYNDVTANYQNTLKNQDLSKLPSYWGGYSFVPYYFEFWEGHSSRINKREVFELINNSDNDWLNYFLQP
ncbi:pyridoxamine 5'-phosphate oxidase family protein [bacterium]|nr:pyridoxamine 5'-phosphate oxidase family protein [bacterium]